MKGIDNIFTEAVLELANEMQDILAEITNMSTTPFMKRKLSRYQVRKIFENLTPPVLESMNVERGAEATNDWLRREYELRQRREGYAER